VAPDKPPPASLEAIKVKTQKVEKESDCVYWPCMLKGMIDKPIDSLIGWAKS